MELRPDYKIGILLVFCMLCWVGMWMRLMISYTETEKAKKENTLIRVIKVIVLGITTPIFYWQDWW